MHVKRAKSGGFIVTHHHKADAGEMAAEPEDHVVPDLQSVQSHMADNMGDQPPAPAAAPAMEAGGAGGQAQAPPAGM